MDMKIKPVGTSIVIEMIELAKKENIENDAIFMEKLYELEILSDADSPEELKFFKALFKELLTIFTTPFNEDNFDFGADEFWSKIANLSERYSKDPQIRKMNGNRGSKHFLYLNRTFFGLYNLLHDLKAKVVVNDFRQYI